MTAGSLLLVVGVGGTVIAIAAGSAPGFFLGTAFAGTGFGLSFLGTFRTLSALAPPSGRAGLIATIYIVSYLAFSLPVIGAGVAVTHFGLQDTAIVYGCAVAAFALAAAAITFAGGRTAAGTVAGTVASTVVSWGQATGAFPATPGSSQMRPCRRDRAARRSAWTALPRPAAPASGPPRRASVRAAGRGPPRWRCPERARPAAGRHCPPGGRRRSCGR